MCHLAGRCRPDLDQDRRGSETSTQTSKELRLLAYQHDDVRSLRIHFNTCAKELRSDCFYHGQCEPEETAQERIEGKKTYIVDTERLAGCG